jgi:hypothetical protein
VRHGPWQRQWRLVGRCRCGLAFLLWCAGGLFALGGLFGGTRGQSLGFFLFVPFQPELAEAMALSGLVGLLLLLLCRLVLQGGVAEGIQQGQLTGADGIAQPAQGAVLQAPGIGLLHIVLLAMPVKLLCLQLAWANAQAVATADAVLCLTGRAGMPACRHWLCQCRPIASA